METYIVRIYRRQEGDPEALIGDVEKAGVDKRSVFHSFKGLCDILTTQGKAKRSGKKLNRRAGR
jgi:hypothetical protein